MKITVYNFKKIQNNQGSLVPIENDIDIPFAIKRVFYISGVSKEKRRGFHAHHNTLQVLICLSGSCQVLMDDGYEKQVAALSRHDQGLLIEPYYWHEMYDFEENTILLVLASDFYNEKDYIRDYNEFLYFVRERDKYGSEN